MSDYYIDNTVQNRKYLEEKGYVFANKSIEGSTITISDRLLGEKIASEADLIQGEVLKSVSNCQMLEEEVKQVEKKSSYHLKNVFKHKEYFDYYDYIDAVRATDIVLDPRIEHVIKKLFVNDRGHKSVIKDVKESIQTLQMYLEKLEGEL